MTIEKPHPAIDESLIREHFIRSPGPGGQNVNKVASAVQLRFDLARAAFPEDVKRRLRRLAGGLLTAGDQLLIHANRYRSQVRNREDARARLLDLVRRAAVQPRARVATAPTRASRERRLQSKRLRARIKRARADLPEC